MRKVILYLAMSLDGYIADPNGGVDWLKGEREAETEESSYEEFIREVDTVIMGWNTYHQITTELSLEEWVYPAQTSYVITHRKEISDEQIRFVQEEPTALVKRLRQQEGKAIWICGGAKIAQQLMREGMIDEFYLSVIPAILGEGIPLFTGGEMPLKLHFLESRTENGIIEIRYRKRDTADE